MVYRKAQEKLAARATRVQLIQTFFGNIAILAGRKGEQIVEINRERAEIAGTYLYLVEGMTRGFRIEYGNEPEVALRRITQADRGHAGGGIYDNERELLKIAVESRFVSVNADDHGTILRHDDAADWALGLDGLGIARAAAYALLGEKPRV